MVLGFLSLPAIFLTTWVWCRETSNRESSNRPESRCNQGQLFVVLSLGNRLNFKIKLKCNCKGHRCCLGGRIYSIPSPASYLPRTILKNSMKFILFFQIILVQFILFFKSSNAKQLAWQGIEELLFPNISDDLCLFFRLYPSSMTHVTLKSPTLDLKRPATCNQPRSIFCFI